MASGKRQPSKQKRSSQNRQQRQALQARKVAATAPPIPASNPRDRRGASSSSDADSTAAPRTSATSGAPRTSGSLLGRLRGTPAAGPAPSANRARTATTRGAAPGGNRRRPDQPAGYSAALAGLLAAVAAAAATFLLHAPVDAQGDSYTPSSTVAEWSTSALEEVEATPSAAPAAVVRAVDDWMPGRSTDRLFLVYFPLSLAVVFPVVGALLTFRAVRQRQPAKVVTRSMYVTLLGAFLTLTLLQLFLPAVIAVTVAGYQVRKSERLAAQAAATDEVIEAEVVDG